jgi:hypothetical protein
MEDQLAGSVIGRRATASPQSNALLSPFLQQLVAKVTPQEQNRQTKSSLVTKLVNEQSVAQCVPSTHPAQLHQTQRLENR